jgi:hypothetical protein
MNMNIQDIHYNKYIKYKTKYLELKELSGGKDENMYGNQYKEIKTKILLFESNYKNINKLEKDFNNEKNETSKHKKYNIYKTNMITNIVSIEDYLLNTLLPELYTINSNDVFIKIFKDISKTIINYREYFYLIKNYKQIYLDSIKKKIKQYEKNIKTNLDSLNLKKFNFVSNNFKKLRKIIEIYFKNVNNSIQKLDSFTYKSENWHINYKNEDKYQENKCLFDYIENNQIIFTNNIIFNNILSNLEIDISKEVEFDISKEVESDITNRIESDITNRIESDISKQLERIYNTDDLSNNRIDIFYSIKELFKLKVLYTFTGNNRTNNIDYIMMLINCYLIIINMFILIKNEQNTFDHNLYLQNLLFKNKEQNGGGDGGVGGLGGGSDDTDGTDGTDDQNKNHEVECKNIDNFNCGIIMVSYYCDENKYNIFHIFERLESIFKNNKNKNNVAIEYKNQVYDMKNSNESLWLCRLLKDDIEKYFPNNKVLTELKIFFNRFRFKHLFN